jgi:uncharacterized membrane protein
MGAQYPGAWLMAFLVATLLLFGAIHILPALPAAKATLKQRLGTTYGPVYGVATLLALALIIYAFRGAARPELYDPPTWGRHANFLLTLLAFICVGVFIFRGSWRNVLKYPMAIAVLLWGIGHLLANGDAATVILVSGLMIAALVHFVLLKAHGPYVPTDERGGHNFMSVLAGVALYGVMTQLHGVIIGMPVLTLVK